MSVCLFMLSRLNHLSICILNIYCLFLTVSVQWGLWSITTHIFPFLAIVVEMFPVRWFCAPSVLFLAFLLFVFFYFICLFGFFCPFLLNGCLNNGMMVIYHSAKFTCFLNVLFWANLAKCICSSTWRYKIFFVAIRNGKGSSKSACKSAFAIGTSFEAITGQLDVLSRSHYSVFYVSWSFKMQLFENIWKDLQFFC